MVDASPPDAAPPADVPTQVFADHIVLRPPNRLRERAVRIPAPNEPREPDPIRRAEQALDLLSSEFDAWMEDELQKLDGARALFAAGRSEGLVKLYRSAHDIRGQATTLGFPLAGEIADGLCALIEGVGDRPPPQPLVERHVDAIRAIVREDVRNREHPLGKALARSLAELRAQLTPPLDGG